MRINSDNPPNTVSGMWHAILKHAESDALTRNILDIAESERMDEMGTLVCLAYAALCSRELSEDIFRDLKESIFEKEVE